MLTNLPEAIELVIGPQFYARYVVFHCSMEIMAALRLNMNSLGNEYREGKRAWDRNLKSSEYKKKATLRGFQCHWKENQENIDR